MSEYLVIIEREGEAWGAYCPDLPGVGVAGESREEVERLIRGSDDFNHRQLALLSDAIRNPERTYDFRTHAARHNITHETARTDLAALMKKGLLIRRKQGQRFLFNPAADLATKLTRD